jgi:hypothetical protein
MFSHNFASVSLATLMSVLSWPAHAQLACTLTVSKEQDLNFSSFIVVADGPITVSPITNQRTGANVVTPAQVMNNPPGPAKFRVIGKGTISIRMRITLAATPSQVSAGMPLSGFVLYPNNTEARLPVLCGSINEVFSVGATLQVSASQARGTYVSENPIVLQATSF